MSKIPSSVEDLVWPGLMKHSSAINRAPTTVEFTWLHLALFTQSSRFSVQGRWEFFPDFSKSRLLPDLQDPCYTPSCKHNHLFWKCLSKNHRISISLELVSNARFCATAPSWIRNSGGWRSVVCVFQMFQVKLKTIELNVFCLIFYLPV